MSDILAMIRNRLRSKVTDHDAMRKRVPLRRASAAGLMADEAKLGFKLPPHLKEIYIGIGNRGFGTGYGLIGMTSEQPDDLGRTSPQIYRFLRSDDPQDSAWAWPDRLLPICHWGCAIYTCVAGSESDFPMRIFDPNVHIDRMSWSDAFFETDLSFEAWITAWADGVDLWEKSDGESGAITLALAQ